MKKIEKCRSIKMMKFMMVMICAVWFFMGAKSISMADSTGRVKEGANVRQSADANSEKVGSLSQGTTVTIINEVTDAAGTLWYEIKSGNTTGYVRNDLIEKSDSAAATVPAATQPASPTAAGAEDAPETTLDAQYATIKASTAIIRSKASKTSGKVDSMPQNTTLIVNGQTNGSDGKTWYYVVFTGTNGVEKNGYVRSDLITLGDMVPVEEPPQEEQPETPPEEDVEAPVVTPDYEVVYEDPKGEGYAWYLHDNTGEQHTRQNLEQILAAVDAQSTNAKIDAATISKQRIAIVILVALVIILAVVLTFMFFKLRDAYVGEDEDDSDNWKAERRIRENRENRERENRERESRENRSGGSTRSSSSSGVRSSSGSAARPGEPVKRKSAPQDGQQPPVRKKAPAKEVTYEDDGTEHPKTAPKKKAKNFLADDDDFEFEFLNMKDKDKDN